MLHVLITWYQARYFVAAAADLLAACGCVQRGSHHRLYQVVRPAVVRAGVEPNSLRTERLRIGERLTIMESREFGGAPAASSFYLRLIASPAYGPAAAAVRRCDARALCKGMDQHVDKGQYPDSCSCR